MQRIPSLPRDRARGKVIPEMAAIATENATWAPDPFFAEILVRITTNNYLEVLMITPLSFVADLGLETISFATSRTRLKLETTFLLMTSMKVSSECSFCALFIICR